MDLFEPPEMRHHPTGHRWLDYVIAGSALVVSIVSLVLGIENGHTMERLVAANSWPSLSNSVSLINRKDDVSLQLSVANKGVGPAFLETMEVWQNGRPVASTHDLARMIAAAVGYAGPPLDLHGGTAIGSVIASHDHATLLDVDFTGLTPAQHDAFHPVVEHQRVRLCYCSVFDECYVADSGLPHTHPKRVAGCPIPEHPFDDDLAHEPPRLPVAPAGDKGAPAP